MKKKSLFLKFSKVQIVLAVLVIALYSEPKHKN